MIILKTFMIICIKLYLFIKLFFFSCSSDDHNASSEEKGMNSKSTLSNWKTQAALCGNLHF